MKNKILSTDRLLAALVALLAIFAAPPAAAQLFWNTNGTLATFTSANWGTSASGPYATSWSGSSDVVFGVASGGTNNVTGATATVGNVTVNGNTTISSAGTLTWKSGGSTVTVADGVTLNWNQSTTTTASGNIVTKAGAGLWILGGYGSSHTATGGSFTLNAGTIRIGGANNFGGANGRLVINGGVIDVQANRTNANSVTINSGFEFTGTSTYAASGGVSLAAGTHTITNSTTSGTRTFSGVISNSGGLTLAGSGAGVIVFSGLNTYTGKTTITSGTLRLTNDGRAGATTSDLEVAGGLLDLGAGTKTNAAFTLSGGSITNGTLQATTYALQGGTIISNATLGTGTATVTTGTTTLNGLLNATTVNVNSGTLNLGASDRLANAAAVAIGGGILGMGANNDTVGTFTMTSGTLDGAGTLTASSYALQGGTVNALLGAGDITVSSGTTALGSAGRLNTASSLTVNSGQLTLGGTETVASLAGSGGTLALGGNTITVGGGNTSTTFSGAISGSGGALTKTGTGALTLAGNTSHTGATTIDGGTLIYNGTNTTSAVSVNSGATLTGSGSVGATTINSGGTMNPGNSPGTQTYASLTWEGGGNYNWQLYDADGAAGTDYDTFVSTGAFTINATSGNKFNINLWTLSSISPSDVNGEAVGFTGASNYTWTLGTFGSISGFAEDKFSLNTVATNGTGGFANLFSGVFSITTNATELLLVYTAPVLGSDYTWSAGSGVWGTAANWTNNATPTNGASIIFAGAGGGASTNLGTVSSISGLLFSNTAGSFTISGDALTVGAAGIDNESSSAQTIDNNLTLGAAQSFLAASGNLTFGGTIDNGGFALGVGGAFNTTINGVISGAGGLTKTGAGSLTLSGANDYSGGTTISAGTVVGTTTSLQGDIANASFLEFSQGSDGTYSGVISGAGLVTKSGAGNVTFSGANTYEGGTIISGGTLTGSTATVPGDVDVSSGATFALSQTTNGTFSVLIEGAGRFVKSGSGDVTLSGANSYSGGTLVSGGTLTGTASSLQGSITNDASVVFVQTPDGTYSGAMSGTGTLTKSGAGSLTLSGANTYSGGTLVSGGSLVGSTTSLQGAITNNATVVMSQTTNGAYSGVISGSGALVKAGSGTVTLEGNNTYAGVTTVGGGGLVAANNNSLSSNSVTMSDGSVLAEAGVTLANNFTIGTAATSSTNFGSTTSLAGWDVNGLAAGATTDAGTGISGVTALNATLGSGISNRAVANALGGAGWESVDAAGSVAKDAFMTFGLSASSSNTVLKLTTLDPFYYRSSSTGPNNATLQYSLDGGSTYSDLFTTNGYQNNTTGGLYGSIDLSSGGSLLQSVGTNGVILRWVNYGASAGTGTWYLRNGAVGDDLVINGQVGTISSIAASGSGNLGINEAGSATFSGNVLNNNVATLTAASGGLATFSGVVSGAGSVTKTGQGTVTLSGNNTYSGGTALNEGVLRLTSATGAGSGSITQSSGTTVEIHTPGTITNDMSIYNVAFLDGATLSGTITVNNATFDVIENETGTIIGVVDGSSGVTKTGLGQLTLSGNNTYSGATAVNAGVLELASTAGGAAALTSSVSVAENAVLLISQSNQVNNNATVSLSGGTIIRGTGVSEQFGALTVSGSSALDFGTGTAGSLTFGTYTPSSLLTVNSFFGGNTLTFGSDLTGSLAVGTYNYTSYTSGDGLFTINSISGGFTTSYSGGSFTITAIPEPSTYLAAAGLLGLMLWPSRKRLLKDAKSILGLRAPMRDRLARRASQA